MAEVKAYEAETKKVAKFTVMGGARDTSYDDMKSLVKRVKNLRKQGMSIYDIHRFTDGSCWVRMTSLEVVSKTPGYQKVLRGSSNILNYHGKTVVRRIN